MQFLLILIFLSLYNIIHRTFTNKIKYIMYNAPYAPLFLYYYTEVAGANGTSHRCYFQIKKINVNASLVFHKIPSPPYSIVSDIV